MGALCRRGHGEERTPRTRKPRAILAFLALPGGEPAERARLAALLWSERGDAQASASLRQALFELREFTQELEPLLIVDRQSVALERRAFATGLERRRCWRRLGTRPGWRR